MHETSVIMYINAQFHGAVVRVMLCSLLRRGSESVSHAGGRTAGTASPRPAPSSYITQSLDHQQNAFNTSLRYILHRISVSSVQ